MQSTKPAGVTTSMILYVAVPDAGTGTMSVRHAVVSVVQLPSWVGQPFGAGNVWLVPPADVAGPLITLPVALVSSSWAPGRVPPQERIFWTHNAVVVVAAGQLTQNVLCFCGSWLNWSLKWRPCLLMGASPAALAVATRVATLMTWIIW